ncbi:MAG: cobalamin biosynthesis protein [Methanosarcinales archaeon]
MANLFAILALITSLIIDLKFGELPEKIHPVVWIGKYIAFLKSKLKHSNPFIEKINGLILVIIITLTAILVIFFIFNLILDLENPIDNLWIYVITFIVYTLLLKSTYAIKAMSDIATNIQNIVEEDILTARKEVAKIVGRDTSNLNEEGIISATIESIAESTVDGITSPMFYFSLFGLAGAYAYRAVNTLDSMVGYKDKEHINIGYFSAKIDMILNLIPSRITAFVMILSAFILRKNWKNAFRILRRDKNNPESKIAGWPISVMAGALDIQLEKKGFYVIGDKNQELRPWHIKEALKIMKLTSLWFVLFSIIIMVFIGVIEWKIY